DAIGRIEATLKERGILDNTLLIFSSDNGGPIQQAATNVGLRAGKGTLYEGGVRVPAWVAGPGKIKPGTVVNEPLHMVNWYPTLLQLAGAKTEQKHPVDGKDMWATIAEGKPSPNDVILINTELNRGAIRAGSWKLVVTRGESTELFNLADDPGEKTNLA